jgi:hypothetical protein
MGIRSASGRKWGLAGGLAALLLAGAGAAPVQAPGAHADDGLALVPRDAQAFVTVRVAVVVKSPLGKKLLARLPAEAREEIGALEKKLGLKLADIERATLVLDDLDTVKAWVVVQSSKALDRKRVLGAFHSPEEVEHWGKKYYRSGNVALFFKGDRVLVFGSEEGVERCMDPPRRPKGTPLTEALIEAQRDSGDLVIGFNLPAKAVRVLRKELERGKTEGGARMLPLLEPVRGWLTASVRTGSHCEVSLDFPDRAKAKNAARSMEWLLDEARHRVGPLAKELRAAGVADASRLAGGCLKELDQIKPARRESSFTFDWKSEGDSALLGTEMLRLNAGRLLRLKADRVRQVVERARATHNLHVVCASIVDFADAHQGKMPTAAIYSKAGKPLLSWRVAVLPYLGKEGAALYKQFKLDEPWDSAHNKHLLSKMPKVFELPGAKVDPTKGQTFFQVFTGPNTAFNGNKPATYPPSFPDSTTQTVLVVTAAKPVPWTAPQDLPYSDKMSPNTQLGFFFGGQTFVAMGDTTVHMVQKQVSEKTLRAAITPAGNDVLSDDW